MKKFATSRFPSYRGIKRGGVNVNRSNLVVIATSKTLELTPNGRKTWPSVDLNSYRHC